MSGPARGAEHRKEVRTPATGEVCFVLEGPGSLEFRGSLIDSSKNGFRAIHSHTGLSTGQEVRFSHSLGQGRVVVVWNRILAPNVETGFLILKK
jgi:hypothetical protein